MVTAGLMTYRLKGMHVVGFLERAFKCKIETKYSRKGIFCPWFDKLIVNLISYRVGKSHGSAVSKVL